MSPDLTTPAPSPTVLIAASEIDGLPVEEVARGVALGFKDVVRDAETALAPLSIGGSGTSALFAGQTLTCPTTDAAGRLTEASYVFDGETAYIDAASTLGSTPLAPGIADSYGLGVLIADAQSRGAQRVVLALNGCPVDDGGVGILVALGVNPLDQSGRTLPKGGSNLETLADFDLAKVNVPAAALEWILVGDEPAKLSSPGLHQLATVTEVEDSTLPSLAIALTWLSTTMHGHSGAVRILKSSELAAGIDASQLCRGYSAVISVGTVTAAFENSELGDVVHVPAQPADSTAESLRLAGAEAAATYLRTSTIQG